MGCKEWKIESYTRGNSSQLVQKIMPAFEHLRLKIVFSRIND